MNLKPRIQTTTKLEAAEAQLTTAIKLFFESGNEIAIHTLTQAAHEILDRLCVSKKVGRGVIHEGLDRVRPELRKKILGKVNEAKNYFKHARSDSGKNLFWNPKVSEYIIWDSTRLHGLLVGTQKIPEIIIYMLWFRLHHDDMWTEADGEAASLDVLLPDARSELGHLSKEDFFKISMSALRKEGFR